MILTSKDFTIINSELVLLNSRGFSLVFFSAQQCSYCDEFKPYFDFVADRVTGCNFFLCDMSQEKQLEQASQYTKTPITYVPLVLLFANGKIINQFFPDEQNPHNNTNLLVKFLQDSTNIHHTSQGVNNPYGGIPYNLNPSRSKTKTCKLADMYTKVTYPNPINK